jgi:prepilin-type N-terminal cleavage/methylation domain-containing protein
MKGFTLVEVMISLALAAMIVGGTLQFHAIATRQVMRQKELAEVDQNLRVTMRILERAVRSAGLGLGEGVAAFQFSNANDYVDPKVVFDRDPARRDEDPDWFRVTVADPEGPAVRSMVFRVDLSDRQVPRLMTAVLGGGETKWSAVADHIEDLQIATILDDGTVCDSVDDPALCDPARVVAVRLTLEGRSSKKIAGLASGEIGGYEDRRAVHVNDHYLRRALISEIQLRNRCGGAECP